MNKYAKRYLIDALSGMAQGLFASLLIGTIVKTLGQQLLHLGTNPVFEFLVTAGGFAMKAEVVGAAMAVGIGHALGASNLVLFSLVTVGAMANVTGKAGGPLAVLVIAIAANEVGMLVSKKTRVDIIVTPIVTILTGILLTVLFAEYIGLGASQFGVGNRASSLLHGNSCFCYCRNSSYASNQFRSYLSCPGTCWSCWWCCRCRMLCTDGWFCSSFIP